MTQECLQPPRIDPEAIYDGGTLCLLLGLTTASVRTARTDGGLRSVRCGRKVLHRGQWVLDWLDRRSDFRTPGKEDADG